MGYLATAHQQICCATIAVNCPRYHDAESIDAVAGEEASAREGSVSNQERLFDIAADIKMETKAAWLLSDGGREAWVPKSVVENNGDGTFTMPVWMAKQKGFV